VSRVLCLIWFFRPWPIAKPFYTAKHAKLFFIIYLHTGFKNKNGGRFFFFMNFVVPEKIYWGNSFGSRFKIIKTG